MISMLIICIKSNEAIPLLDLTITLAEDYFRPFFASFRSTLEILELSVPDWVNFSLLRRLKSQLSPTQSDYCFVPKTHNFFGWKCCLDLKEKLSDFQIQNYFVIVVIFLAGSHDSMTYSISGKSSFAPDADNWLLNIKWLGEPLRSFVSRWSITQSADTLSQLEHGIR